MKNELEWTLKTRAASHPFQKILAARAQKSPSDKSEELRSREAVLATHNLSAPENPPKQPLETGISTFALLLVAKASQGLSLRLS
jgi:hypothetical protein